MDLIAEALDMDPIELRRINAQRVGATTATGQLLRESVGMLDSLDQVYNTMKKGDNSAGAGERATRLTDGVLPLLTRITGLGGGAPDKAGAEIEAYADGSFEVARPRRHGAGTGDGHSSVRRRRTRYALRAGTRPA